VNIKRIKKLLAVFLMLFTVNVNATGFPTVDIAALLQRLMDYLTQNGVLAEEIAQYAQLVEEYALLYEEYRMMYDNLQAYTDINSLTDEYMHLVEQEMNEALQDLLSLDPASANFEEQVSIIYEDYHVAPHDDEYIDEQYSTVFDHDDLDIIHHNNDKNTEEYDRYLDTYKVSGRGLDNSNERLALISAHTDRINSLSENQEMRALQLLNAQVNLQTQQNEVVHRYQHELLLRREEEQRKALDAKLQEQEHELQRVKRQSEESHTDYSIDTWMM
jgi:hypothetical protein